MGDCKIQEDPVDDLDRVEPGDQVSMTTVHDPAEFIWATATTSERLAEAFTRNSATPKSFCESVPSQLHDFEDVFSKILFDALLDRKPWDHAIHLDMTYDTFPGLIFDVKSRYEVRISIYPLCHVLYSNLRYNLSIQA